MSKIIVKVQNLDELKKFAESLIGKLGPRQILLLEGPMGVGKTTFVRALLDALGVESNEGASPTFAIHHRYDTREKVIDHLDLYRIESEEDLESTGFWDLFDAREGLIIIEWANKLKIDSLPPQWKKSWLRVSFDEQNQALREYRFSES